jgi:hypothetical protein
MVNLKKIKTSIKVSGFVIKKIPHTKAQRTQRKTINIAKKNKSRVSADITENKL